MDRGAGTQTLCAVMPDKDFVNGAYYADGEVAEEAQSARNTEDARKLYDYCKDVTKAYP